MMHRYEPHLHHRRSIRLRGYDYTQDGAYFVTLCTRDRVCLFGDISNGEMRLNKFGRMCAATWTWLGDRYDFVELDVWIVMPNHFHGILVITDGTGGSGRGGSRTAPTMASAAAKRKPLGRLIGAFKTVCTKRINLMRGTPGAMVWQRNYYEHIIRDEPSMLRIRDYITTNPACWAEDVENPAFVRGRR